ncbi:hypothetical protein Pelo_12014 [Pelomyxa schiedti]|nr:hypothetical protein Pelo_12014 [Pelomyxa schiedti]
MKAVVVALVIVLWCGSGLCQRDKCGSATVIKSVPFQEFSDTITSIASHIDCDLYSKRLQKFRGEFWQFTPESDMLLTASLCDGKTTDFDTLLFIFTECIAENNTSTQCIDYNDDFCVVFSEVTWQAKSGITYFIFITGKDDQIGAYQLNLYSPDNTTHQCESAIEIDSLPFRTVGSTSLAPVSFSPCQETESPGVWYSIIGNGSTLIADTCAAPTLNTIIEVMEDCDTCLTMNDDLCEYQSQILWDTIPGHRYFIKVEGGFNAKGQFTLSVNTAQPIPNYKCTTAEEITTPYLGTTDCATVPLSYNECIPDLDPNELTLWWKVIGTGNIMAVSTCHANELEPDTFIGIYTDCDEATNRASNCVAWADDECYVHSIIAFPSVANQTYYIGIAAYFEGGIFTMSVDEVEK